jgi:hypothetical protein
MDYMLCELYLHKLHLKKLYNFWNKALDKE